MKKKTCSILAAVCMACLLALPLAACKAHKDNAATDAKEASVEEFDPSKKTIYATFFPVADLTKRIVGDKMNVKTIIKPNQEPHSFELGAKDMAEIQAADLVVYNGAGMESFIPDLRASIGDDSKFLDLSQGLELLQHKSAQGLSDLADGETLDSAPDVEVVKDADKHSGETPAGVNPHTWLSIKNAMTSLDTIFKKISVMDPENAEYYKKNYAKALLEFQALDKKFETTLANVPEDRRYFVASHAAFNYLARDYKLKQVAVTGISPEDEPTAAQLSTIADFVHKHHITTIFFEGAATPKVANTLAENTGAHTSTLYTMENLSEDDIKTGYIGLMEKNLDALMESFN